MKILHVLAATGLLMTGVVAAAPAEAQSYRDYRGYDRYEDRGDYRDRRDYRDGRGWERSRYANRRWNRGRHNGWRNHQRCWTEYRRGGPVRVCRR
jgi:hypothetical protein